MMSNFFNPSEAVPVLETERLRMRCHRVEDLDASAAMWSDLDVVRYIGGRAFTKEEAWARLHRYVGHWALLGFGYWLVEEKETGRFVGEVGLSDFKREIVPSLDGMTEIGWALATSMHGKGYATEAVRAALAWGEGHFGKQKKAVCLISPENLPSFRVAEKCGFKELQRTAYKGQSTVLLARG